jgi:hypothetical protein
MLVRFLSRASFKTTTTPKATLHQSSVRKAIFLHSWLFAIGAMAGCSTIIGADFSERPTKTNTVTGEGNEAGESGSGGQAGTNGSAGNSAGTSGTGGTGGTAGAGGNNDGIPKEFECINVPASVGASSSLTLTWSMSKAFKEPPENVAVAPTAIKACSQLNGMACTEVGSTTVGPNQYQLKLENGGIINQVPFAGRVEIRTMTGEYADTNFLVSSPIYSDLTLPEPVKLPSIDFSSAPNAYSNFPFTKRGGTTVIRLIVVDCAQDENHTPVLFSISQAGGDELKGEVHIETFNPSGGLLEYNTNQADKLVFKDEIWVYNLDDMQKILISIHSKDSLVLLSHLEWDVKPGIVTNIFMTPDRPQSSP